MGNKSCKSFDLLITWFYFVQYSWLKTSDSRLENNRNLTSDPQVVLSSYRLEETSFCAATDLPEIQRSDPDEKRKFTPISLLTPLFYPSHAGSKKLTSMFWGEEKWNRAQIQYDETTDERYTTCRAVQDTPQESAVKITRKTSMNEQRHSSGKPWRNDWLKAAGAYPGFCSMKWLGVFLLPAAHSPAICSVSPTIHQYSFILLGGERHGSNPDRLLRGRAHSHEATAPKSLNWG